MHSRNGKTSPCEHGAVADALPRLGPAYLTQPELARRWRLSGRTLEKWRWTKDGPPHLKVGGRVLYRLTDVEAFEVANMRGGV